MSRYLPSRDAVNFSIVYEPMLIVSIAPAEFIV